MSSINAIPIQVIPTGDGLTGQANAVLTEVVEMVKCLLDKGMEDSIDLRGLPLSPADRDWLKSQLGQGEVEITLNAGGRSTLTETACAGIWWITHCDAQERVVAELIEVAWVPAIVRADTSEVERGYRRLLTVATTKSRGVPDNES